MDTLITKQQFEQETGGFTGTEGYHRFNLLSPLVMTDGAKYVADTYKCYWLMDLIASYHGKKLGAFQCWNIKVANEMACIHVTDGNNHTLLRKKISYTDLKVAEMDLWVGGYDPTVIYLPSEH
jgi:hypothetical protein